MQMSKVQESNRLFHGCAKGERQRRIDLQSLPDRAGRHPSGGRHRWIADVLSHWYITVKKHGLSQITILVFKGTMVMVMVLGCLPQQCPGGFRPISYGSVSSKRGCAIPFSSGLNLHSTHSRGSSLVRFCSCGVEHGRPCVCAGLMYFDLSDSLNFGATDRFSSQFFILAFMLFIPAYGAVTLWDNERKLVKVETNRKSYSIFSYFLAKTATTWPMEISQCLVMSLTVYWMIGTAVLSPQTQFFRMMLVGYQSGADKFFVFFLIVVLFQLISESLGLVMLHSDEI